MNTCHYVSVGSTERRMEPTGSFSCCYGQRDRPIGGGRQGMLVQEPYAQPRVECDNARHPRDGRKSG
jgi:hypothetical protein